MNNINQKSYFDYHIDLNPDPDCATSIVCITGEAASVDPRWDPEQIWKEFDDSLVAENLRVKENVEPSAGVPLVMALIRFAAQKKEAELSSRNKKIRTQYVTQQIKQQLSSLTNKYAKHARFGGWIARGVHLKVGEDGKVVELANPYPLVKLLNPRQVEEKKGKVKVLKYENPPKAPAPPFFPALNGNTKTAYQQKVEEFLGDLNGQANLALGNLALNREEPFWGAIAANPNIPVAITEGVKKALALTSQGVPAVGLRGITMWREPLTDNLHPQLALLAQPGRRFYLFFDEDTKEKTRDNVAQQTKKLAYALKQRGCELLIVSWNTAQGKGIDDVLWAVHKAQGDPRTELLNLMANAKGVSEVIKEQVIQEFKAKPNLDALGVKEEDRYCSKGGDLKSLPPLKEGYLCAVSAPMGTGKTQAIGECWVKPWKQGEDNFVLVLTNRNSLGYQVSERWDLPHLREFEPAKEYSFDLINSQMQIKRGVALCFDSLRHLKKFPWLVKTRIEDGKEIWEFQKNILVVLDEANQGLNYVINGNTLREQWSEFHRFFKALLENAKAVVAAEAELLDNTVATLAKLSRKQILYVYHTLSEEEKAARAWDITLYNGHIRRCDDYFADMFRSIDERVKLKMEGSEEGRLLIMTSSKAAAKDLYRLITCREQWSTWLESLGFSKEKIREFENSFQAKPKDYNSLEVVVVCAETSSEYAELFSNPDEWLKKEKPDVLICTPSMVSGVSIEGNLPPRAIEENLPPEASPYFSAVWGYFPSGNPDLNRQMLARYRPRVPRYVYTPPKTGNKGFSAKQVWRDIAEVKNTTIQGFDASETLTPSEEDASHQSLLTNVYCENRARQSWGQLFNYDVFRALYEEDGHRLIEIKLSNPSLPGKMAKALMKEARKKWEEEEAKRVAKAVVNEQDVENVEEAKRLLKFWTVKQELYNMVKSPEERKDYFWAKKVLLSNRFRGVDFNDSKLCLAALKNYGRLQYQVMNYAHLVEVSAAIDKDRERLAQFFEGQYLKPYHWLPKETAKALILVDLGIDQFILNFVRTGKTYSKHTPEVQAIAEKALEPYMLDAIRQYWGCQFTKDTKPINVVNGLLRKLGFDIECQRASHFIKEQGRPWLYTVSQSDYHQELTEAYLRGVALKREKKGAAGQRYRECPFFSLWETLKNKHSGQNPPKIPEIGDSPPPKQPCGTSK